MRRATSRAPSCTLMAAGWQSMAALRLRGCNVEGSEVFAMKIRFAFLVLPAMVVIGACDDNDTPTSSSDRGGTTGNTTMTFFVSSATSVTGNLGGPRGADAV